MFSNQPVAIYAIVCIIFEMENTFVDYTKRIARPHSFVPLGIGDDAALLANIPNMDTVVATDMLCDGVHFISSEVTPQQIGRKAMAVNLSDIAAMTATPVAAFVSVVFPNDVDASYAQQVMDGVAELADEFDVSVAGGDTNSWNGKLAINVCLTGYVARNNAKLRSTAEPGDAILVTGELGGSILGHHLSFRPRVDEALSLARSADVNACMDITDGILLDLSRMMDSSKTGAVIEFDQIPVSAAANKLALETNRSPLDHALTDGEDFELLFTLPAVDAKSLLQHPPFEHLAVRQVGRVIGEAAGVFREMADGSLLNIPPDGFEHKWKS